MARNPLELLSPAGSLDALKAAFANGADAVYLGAAAFGARSSAGFDEAQLREALRIAHLRRKKIYVTVNILIKERETAEVRRTLSLLSHEGADAVLVQDLGVLKICREEFPELPVHASTQMALHNAQGAALLKSLGARRAVMARECDLEALRQAAATGMEIEAFCHGALCVSCSGQCLFSSMIGGRSGNRGRCAQPCRLPYTYQGKTAAWLSPRDLCARDELQKMADAGVYSFKIEGRLKRPEYVAVVTRAYRNALDAVLAGRFSPMDEGERESLTQIFSRGGFTRGYTGHEEDAGVIFPKRVTPEGVPIGQAETNSQTGGRPLCGVRLQKALHNGDGLEIDGQTVIYSGPDCPAGSLATVRVHGRVRPGAPVRRTDDEAQLSAARATYEGTALDAALPIPFDAELTAYPGKEALLAVTDGESRAQAQGPVCEAAQNKALDESAARRAVEKTGGTPFALRSLTVKTAGAFLPAAALNALRREALSALTEARIAAQPRESVPRADFTAPMQSIPAPRLIVKTFDPDQVPALLAAGADEALVQPRDFRMPALLPLLDRFPQRARLTLPAQCRTETLDAIVAAARERNIPLCVSSPGQLEISDMAGEGVPVMNGEALRMLSYLGCASAVLSRELSREDALALPEGICEMILPVYGRARLMLLNHCPMRTALGLSKGRAACERCAQGSGAAGTCLTDRLGAQYPLMPLRLQEGCQIELMAAHPLHLSGYLQGMERFSWLLSFTDEPMDARVALTRHYAALQKGETPPPVKVASTTAGRFPEGVL